MVLKSDSDLKIDDVQVLKILESSRREGTQNQGIEYECKMCALLALRCAISYRSKSIRNFWITHNVDDPLMGKFDDVIMVLELETGKMVTYCMQLKHYGPSTRNDAVTYKTMRQEHVKRRNNQKNQLYLDDYLRSIPKAEERESANVIRYVLFTNRKTEADEERFVPRKDEDDCFSVIDTGGRIFGFDELEIDGCDVDGTVLKRFFVFSDQANEENLEKLLEHTVKSFANFYQDRIKDVTGKYMSYVESWFKGNCGGRRPLSKHEIKFKLCEYLLNPYLFRSDFQQIFVPNLAQELMAHYQLILVDNCETVSDACKDFTNLAFSYLRSILQNYATTTNWNETLSGEELKQLALWRTELVNLWGCNYEDGMDLKKLVYFLWQKRLAPLIIRIEKEKDLEVLAQIRDFTCGKFVVLYAKPFNAFSIQGLSPDYLLYNYESVAEGHKQTIMDLDVRFQNRRVKFRDLLRSSGFLSKLTASHIFQIALGKFAAANLPNYSIPEIFIQRQLNAIYVDPKILTQETLHAVTCRSEEAFWTYVAKSRTKIRKENVATMSGFEAALSSKLKLPNGCKVLLSAQSDSERIQQIQELCNNISVHNLTSSNEIQLGCAVNVIVAEKAVFFANIEADPMEVYEFEEIDLERMPVACRYVLIAGEHLDRIENLKFNAHFYRINADGLEFLGCKGSCPNVKDYAAAERKPSPMVYDVNYMYSCNAINVLSGSPGMGKSILVNYLAKNCPPKLLTIVIALNTHLKYLSDGCFNEPLKHFLGYDDLADIDRALVDDYVRAKRICLYVDGFDEIEPETEAKACDFIRTLAKQAFTTFVTTRPSKVDFLETSLGTVARNVLPFTRDDQFTYLTQRYETIKGYVNTNDERIGDFVAKLLNKTGESASAWDTEFSAVPLQIVMIADIYQEQCRNYCTGTLHQDFEPNASVDALELYRKFIDFKISHLHRKENVHFQFDRYFQRSVERSLDVHKVCAIRAIFGDVETSYSEYFIEKLHHDGKIGLIDRFLADKTPVFVHRTFAEYLVALYVTENLHMDYGKDLLKRIFANSVYDVIRRIIDRILANECKMHMAVLNRDVATFETLLGDANELEKKDAGGRNVLHLIMSWGRRHVPPSAANLEQIGKETQRKLLQTKVTNLHRNIRQGHSDANLAHFLEAVLLAAPLLTQQKDKIFKETPLDYAVRVKALQHIDAYLSKTETKTLHNLYSYTEAGLRYKKFAKYFLKHYIAEASSATDDLGLLVACACYDYSNLANHVLANGPPFWHVRRLAVGARNLTLLHVACYFDSTATVQLLLDAGVDVNASDGIEKFVPLHLAAHNGNAQIVAALLKNGADVKATDKDGFRPLYAALVNSQSEVVRVLSDAESKTVGDAKTKVTELMLAVIAKDADRVKALLESGEDPNERNDGDWRPLMEAAENGFLDMVRLLLEHGADPNVTDTGGMTAMMWAVVEGRDDVVEALLEAGTDPSTANDRGLTALNLAQVYRHASIVKLFTKV